MKGEHSLKRQAMVTAGSGALVRFLGFGLRLWLSRNLGAEALGVMELASGVHALAVTPGAAGLPGAVSRLTALADSEEERAVVLRSARRIAWRIGLILAPIFFFSSPWIARILGDSRTLPSLMLYAPCVLLVAVACVYDGASFGQGRPLPPALGELTEQLVRLAAVLGLSFLIPRVTVAWRAAIPAAATVLGEAAGLAIVRRLVRYPRAVGGIRADRQVQARLRRLSLPLLLNRLTHTGLHSLCGVIIPLRLAASGLSHSEALSRLGMLNGMAMPLMFLPGLFSGALAAVGGPAVARCRDRGRENALALRMIAWSLAAGAVFALALYRLAPLLAARLYRLPELTFLLRACCPLAVLLPVQQTVGGVLTGLGLQKKALTAGLIGAAATLLYTWQWVFRLGIQGAAFASVAGHALTLTCSLICLCLRNDRGPCGKRLG